VPGQTQYQVCALSWSRVPLTPSLGCCATGVGRQDKPNPSDSSIEAGSLPPSHTCLVRATMAAHSKCGFVVGGGLFAGDQTQGLAHAGEVFQH
jgi:hypothetical protein